MLRNTALLGRCWLLFPLLLLILPSSSAEEDFDEDFDIDAAPDESAPTPETGSEDAEEHDISVGKRYFAKQGAENATKAMLIAEHPPIRCKVCEVIVTHLVETTTNTSAENLYDRFTGVHPDTHEQEFEEGAEAQIKEMLRHRRGCNRNFKDSFLRLGWQIAPARDCSPHEPPPRGLQYVYCIKKKEKPEPLAVDVYNVFYEAVYHACALTLEQYADELSEYVGNKLFYKHKLSYVARTGCRKAADCEDTVKKQEEEAERAEEEKARKKAERRKKKKAEKEAQAAKKADAASEKATAKEEL